MKRPFVLRAFVPSCFGLLACSASVADEPFVDSLVVPAAERPAAITRPTLLAPEMTPEQVELPATVPPAEHLADALLRRSDVNLDGVVNDTDVAVVTAAFGPCANAGGCAEDINKDGVIDPADQAVVREHFGRRADESEDAFADKVGYSQPAQAALFPRLPDQARADGWRIAKTELRSANAAGLRLQLSELAGAEGLELRIYDPDGTSVFGPYVNPRRGEDGTWWTPIIFGERIGIEVALSPRHEKPQVMPKIDTVTYLFCDGIQCHGTPGSTMACHNDITCNASWADNEGRGAALIYFNSGGGCARCSGALLNRGPGDFCPLFFTAHHCINTQAEADTVEVFWHYNTPTCNGTPPNYDDLLRSDGAILVKRHPGTDWTLLGLLEPVQTNVFLGWDANAWASGGGATGVHHPRGTFKRISTGTSSGSTDGSLFCDPAGTVSCTCNGMPSTCISVDTFNVSYTSGTTEPGSSGSPIFDATRRVRGTLTGGPSGCPTVTARYGRFDRAFANLRYFLNDGDVPNGAVFVNSGVGGDPGNNGTNERGTALNPFNSVGEASFCVRSGQEMRIVPGTYGDRLTILRPMTLIRDGASGTVTIGQ